MWSKCLSAAGAAVFLASVASAHDFETVFTSRSECQRALQEINKVDFFLEKPGAMASEGLYTPGDVRAFLARYFQCQKVGEGWMQVYTGPAFE